MNLLGKLRRLHYREGLNLSEIERRTGLTRKTIRERPRSRGAPCWSTARAGGSVRPARGDRSARPVPIRKTPRQKAGLKGDEISPAWQNFSGPRFDSYAHFVARRSFLLKRRQASQQPLLQRAARSNFFSARRNTLSQTLQPFGTRCQPCCCLRSSPVPSVVSATESNPTQSVCPSSFLPPRCHPMVSKRRFPI